jgi:hypothetical protein
MDRRICFLVALLSVSAAAKVLAVSNFTGRHVYVAVMGSSHRNPIFTKEFTEGAGVPTIGGNEEFALPDQDSSIGVRVGYEKISRKRSGLGLSLTYWHTQFEDISFLYDRDGSDGLIAAYRKPSQDLVFLDLNGVFLPWVAGWQALGVYGQVSLVTERQKYWIDKYTSPDGLAQKNGLVSRKESALETRFGFGVGMRVHLAKRLSLWLEKRWIVGESFSRPVAVDSGGTTAGAGGVTGERQETLYAPISSFGVAAYF